MESERQATLPQGSVGRVTAYEGFDRVALDDEQALWCGQLPSQLDVDLSELWALHPAEFHEVQIMGKGVPTPRFQQAYDRDYQYTGSRNNALPLHPMLGPLLRWSRTLDVRLNGVLVNWYDSALGHYIGKHRDSEVGLVPGAPIVTVSFGETWRFRVRPVGGRGFRDFPLPHGAVFILPFSTNKTWKHEVPKLKANRGQRISVTFRAFQDEGD